ncbi:DUF2252 domain-containing protein [Acinetobacter genomosp. 15BJ]|uniref:DUF2252 domain-containing protein n=1 Tax=Acinetobacter genomosp. 15BJ TaxID=106651 RepID=R9ASJ6_9GAMM|nr:DUF2252 domain-containing protein [Acinetobacter genomosp. 15BJ]EOR03046.1 hypothetical protein F896_03702 [Acinetobacter genomosp. 15BJ]MCH7291812.1 DUF2252 domain-containing protein [Acinetobacter genomosp. 15BJ]MDO3659119.1 DUF2252 domain-containing protein [Acinetobacter genomosp. 15BJ]
MSKPHIKLPKQLWAEQSIDLTRHRYQGKLLTKSEGVALGKAQRKKIPREQLAQLSERPKDITALTLYDWSNEGRLERLKPIRAKRMSVSPFTFYRGMPALMLFDQVWEQCNSGLFQQICGDCHLSNFGGFASPERNLLFGINDFDETLVAPFEWDLKRLVTSFVIAAKDIDLGEEVGLKAIQRMLTAYVTHLEQQIILSPLQTWYEKIDASTLLEKTENQKVRKKLEKKVSTASRRDSSSILPKLTQQDEATGFRHFIEDEPLLWHPQTGEPFSEGIDTFFESYRSTLKYDRQVLFDRYQCTDVALKVVGVGSVGTRSAIALFEDADREPLILQMKEANPSILSPLFLQKARHEGERVVYGQQLMQAASDIFLGYSSAQQQHYLVRQLRDMKVSIDLAGMDDTFFEGYADSCGLALAHAHAKAGNADVLRGYLGEGDTIIKVLQEYALQYEARNLDDYQQFMHAIADTKIQLAGDEVL